MVSIPTRTPPYLTSTVLSLAESPAVEQPRSSHQPRRGMCRYRCGRYCRPSRPIRLRRIALRPSRDCRSFDALNERLRHSRLQTSPRANDENNGCAEVARFPPTGCRKSCCPGRPGHRDSGTWDACQSFLLVLSLVLRDSGRRNLLGSGKSSSNWLRHFMEASLPYSPLRVTGGMESGVAQEQQARRLASCAGTGLKNSDMASRGGGRVRRK
jgi:hypothetical protein